MRIHLLLTIARVAFAALAAVAIVAQLLDLAAAGSLNLVNFFSYFTIQSNVIAIVALLLAVATGGARGRRRADLVRGGAVVYMSVTGVVYALLLQGTDVDTAIVWVNAVVHQVMPIVIVLDWLLDPPAERIGVITWRWWLAYPVVWVMYTMVRGPVAGWYPYPFLDPANGGYGQVIATIVAIFVAGAVLCAVVATIGNALGNRRVIRD